MSRDAVWAIRAAGFQPKDALLVQSQFEITVPERNWVTGLPFRITGITRQDLV
jgi:hypothetical protein